MKFTVVIEDWARGEGGRGALLFDPSNQSRCCLGFAAKDLGVRDRRMALLGNPCEIYGRDTEKITGILVEESGAHTEFAGDAIDINDNPDIDDNERMKRLSALAIEHGHEFEFVHKQAA